MMKFLFAFGVLLQLCYSYNVNMTLNSEIIQRLEKLNGPKKVNITTQTIRVPSEDMNKKASSCVSVFVRELKHILDNVTVHEDKKPILKELQANLQVLDPNPQIDHKCTMLESNPNKFRLFKPFTRFLRKLNSEKR